MKPLPPTWILNFFRWYCHPRLVDHIEGDLIEVYRQRRQQMSRRRADLKFMKDVLLLFRPGIIRPRKRSQRFNPYVMHRNYLKVCLRVFNRERMYSIINISGLALGFMSCLLIYLFVSDELSYDKFHNDNERIYRVASAYMRQNQWEPYATNSWRTGELIKSSYGEVEELVRIMGETAIFEYGEKRITEVKVAWVDENFFKVFSFPMLEGNVNDALKGTNKVVISQSTAEKYFGTENAIGKVFKVSDPGMELQVSGVMDDMPSNAHFHFDFLISGETLRQAAPEQLFTHVGWDSQRIYVKLAAGTDPVSMEATFPEFINKNLEYFNSESFKLFLQPLLSIHLQSNIGLELEDNGNMYRIYTFSIIAIFILVIAYVNYINLTTARSLRRIKEVGMRKVLGAKRGDLISQFLTESFIMTAAASLLALISASILLPEFNQFAGKQIPTTVLLTTEVLGGLLGSLILVSLISGFYPAVILSSSKPMSTKQKAGTVRSDFMLTRGLVVLQFTISIGLIAASAIVFQQWDYMKNKPLGINKDMVVAFPLQTAARSRLSVFQNELFGNAAIKQIGFSNMRMPGWISNSTPYKAQDVESDEEVNKSMKIIRIDHDFFSTLEADIINGRNFSRNFPVDSTASLILNESAVAQLKWKDPVGKWMELNDRKYTVVGVVKDFHFESLHRQIPPTIFVFSYDALNWAYLRIDQQDVPGALKHIEKTYAKFVPDRDFTYSFLNDDIERQYAGEQKFTQVFTIFTVLAIIVACLGTLGLISFTAERKSKEIGIRKVLGASVGSVSFLLIREFITLLIISSAIALPLTWYLLDTWIDGFVYRISIGAGPFVLATVLALMIVVLTTGFRAMKAALANPVDALRNQ